MESRYRGQSAIARYCGVTRQAVHKWIKNHGPDAGSTTPMPEPRISVVSKDGSVITYAWATEQLPDILDWIKSNNHHNYQVGD